MPDDVIHVFQQAPARYGVNRVSFPEVNKSGNSAHILNKRLILQIL